MNDKNKILWITRTAIFTALLIVLQAVTVPLGNVIITGTIVNLLLIVTVMTCGFASGFTVAIISPVIAKFFGIGPLWILIPFIAAGNIVLIFLWYLVGNQKIGHRYIAHIAALIVAAIAKFLILYIGIVQIAIPLFLDLPEQQASVISHMFSISQLITALAGGVLAAMILPALKKAIKVS